MNATESASFAAAVPFTVTTVGGVLLVVLRVMSVTGVCGVELVKTTELPLADPAVNPAKVPETVRAPDEVPVANAVATASAATSAPPEALLFVTTRPATVIDFVAANMGNVTVEYSVTSAAPSVVTEIVGVRLAAVLAYFSTEGFADKLATWLLTSDVKPATMPK